MKRRIWIGGFVVLGIVGWYLFRPELLFVNTQVHEEQVASVGASVMRELATGRFHSVAHETHGTATIQDVGGRRVLRLTELGFAVEGREGACGAMFEDGRETWHPVGALAVDEMSHDDVRAPGGGALVSGGPGRGQPAQQGVERGGRAGENGQAVLEEVH